MSEKTAEELQAELDQLKADNAAQIASLRKESAAYRVGRNDALRQVKALGTVVKAHNIRFSLEDADLSGLTIQDGQVEGEFVYKLPTGKDDTTAPPTGDPAKTVQGLTLDDIKTMSAAELDDRWDEVQTVMASNRKAA